MYVFLVLFLTKYKLYVLRHGWYDSVSGSMHKVLKCELIDGRFIVPGLKINISLTELSNMGSFSHKLMGLT